MQNTVAELRSVALSFPTIRRTNNYWLQEHPDLVDNAEQEALARLWKASEARNDSAFGRTMAPYARDPFRGAVERRWRAPGETALRMEADAARKALRAAGCTAEDLDQVIVTSLRGDRFLVGNAALLAAELGITCPCFNYESACAGGVLGMQLADTFIRAGQARRVLVVISASNSQNVDIDDTTCWFLGDGAAAMVFEASDQGVVAGFSVPSTMTNDMFVMHLTRRGEKPVLRTRPSPEAARMAKEAGEHYLHAAVHGALERAGLSVSDIDHWCLHAPSAWYPDFCAESLGIPAGRYNNEYHRYANTGAASVPSTLYHALHSGQLAPGALAGLFAIGSTSSAAALVLRVGDVALGPYPAPPAQPDADLHAQSSGESHVTG